MLEIEVKNDNISIMVDMLKAIADKNRIKIIKALSGGPLCVCQIEELLDLPQNLVSHHLSTLKEVGVVKNCRCGKNQFYSLNKKSLGGLIKKIKELGG